MIGVRLFVMALGLSLVLVSAPVRGQLLAADSEEIGIDAEQITYDQRNNLIEARGAVVITRGNTALRADEVRVNRTTNVAHAIGNVTVTDPQGTIIAEEMDFNLDDETGRLTGAEIHVHRQRYSLWGDRIEKGLAQNYRIENGRFTTCTCSDGAPSWSISAQDVRVTMGEYGTLRNGTFNILDVPVFYLPRGFFPLQRERQSGLLTPRFGVSNQRGFQTILPLYWAIDKSQDATVSFDLETSARLGVVTEYRYALGPGSRGALGASYFNDVFRGTTEGTREDSTIPSDRWSVEADQTQRLGERLQAYTDALIVGDNLYLREINTYATDHFREVALRTLPFTASRAGIIQDWNRAAFKAEGTYYQNLTAIDPLTNLPIPGALDGETLQRVPETRLWAQRRLVGGLMADLDASGIAFQRGRGSDGLRFDVNPGLTLPLPLPRRFTGAVRLSLRETAYHLTDNTPLDAPEGTTLPTNQSRELLQIDGELGTTLSRVYPFHWLGIERLKHTIEPAMQYRYIPTVDQDDLPLFDGVDRVNRRNLLTYGFASRFIGRLSQPDGPSQPDEDSGSQVRELGRFSITQSADISRQIEPLQSGRSADHFSDIDIAGRVNPSRYLSARFLTNYDTANTNFSAAHVALFVEDPRSLAEGEQRRLELRSSAAVAYRILTENRLQEIDSRIVLRLTDWAGFMYATRYDVVFDRFLDNFFGLRLLSTCDCWALDLSVTDRRNPHEVEVRAQVTLVGLGSAGTGSRARLPEAP